MKRLCSLTAAVALFSALAVAQDYSTYKPVFQTDVYVVNPFTTNQTIDKKTQVNPAYALSETSALELAAVLKDYGVTIFHSGPFGWFTSGQFTVTRSVPWLQFPNGAICNAGLIAWYWSHGFPPNVVMLWVKSDLDSFLKFYSEHPGIYDWIARTT